jgi:nitronate monooxygenase
MIARLEELLEAERAGVKCLIPLAEEAPAGKKKELLVRLRNDEGRFCAGLVKLIEARGAAAHGRTGSFAEKVLALTSEPERIALLIKGQAWVVRKIDEIPAAEMTAEEKAFFADMREAHVVNIEAVRELAA